MTSWCTCGQDADFQEDETIYDSLRLEELDQVLLSMVASEMTASEMARPHHGRISDD